MRASNWRPRNSHTLQGFFDLQLASGLLIDDCTLHEKNADTRWIPLLSKPLLDPEGRQRRDAGSKALYVSVVQIPSHEAWDSFQRQALAAVDRMLGR
jgi:hypothetical protein